VAFVVIVRQGRNINVLKLALGLTQEVKNIIGM
jgi:hypothetical protein